MRIAHLFASQAPRSTLLVRLAVGAVFLVAGTLKFLDPEQVGPARFAQIGIPMPELLFPLVAAFEIACGALVLVGLATRFAAVPLVVIMLVAIAATKIPTLPASGFWAFANATRLDFSMLMSALFLFFAGAGPWSLEARIAKRAGPAPPG